MQPATQGLDELKEIMQKALDLAKSGDKDRATKLLEDFLSKKEKS